MKFLNNIISNVSNAIGIEIEDDFTKMITPPSPMSAATRRLCGTLLATFRRRPLTTFWILSLQRRTG